MMNRIRLCSQTPRIRRCHHGPCGSSSGDHEGDSLSPSLACSYNRRHPALEQWHSYRAAALQSCRPLHLLSHSSAHLGGLSAPACWCTASLCEWASVCAPRSDRWSVGGKSSRWSLGECVVVGRSYVVVGGEVDGCLVEEAEAAGEERWTLLGSSLNPGSPHGGRCRGCSVRWDHCRLWCWSSSHRRQSCCCLLPDSLEDPDHSRNISLSQSFLEKVQFIHSGKKKHLKVTKNLRNYFHHHHHKSFKQSV